MARRFACSTIAIGLVSAGWLFLMSGVALGQDVAAGYPPPNYYAAPGGCGQLAAALYPSPRPTPPLVGWTYITYQPFAPHQYLYPHCDCYTQRHCEGGVTHTWVCYCHCKSWCPSVMRPVPVPCTPPAGPHCPSE
ncbi:MAG: hypothetical protein ABSG86_11120 [Thermoguttaceae bacterium]